MDGLTIGLAFGLAAAGGVAGVALTFMGDLVAGFGAAIWGGRAKEHSKLAGGLVGAFAGAVLGMAIGSGVGYFSNDEATEPPRAAIQECYDKAEREGKEAVIGRDDLGQPVCSLQ